MMPPQPPFYPWYAIASGDEIQQGDILDGCPVFSPRTEATGVLSSTFDWRERDLIVMSQTCDLVRGREKVEEVLLSAMWRRSEIRAENYLAQPRGLEDARRGNLPAFHLLAPCEEQGFERELRIVDFRRCYTLPFPFVRQRLRSSLHLRLLPPYREHLSQAFARFFMRVGLPIDIPPFL
jgi:hypothetical protein